MKVERKYSHTLPKGSRRGTEYSEPQLGSNPNVNSTDSNNSDLNSSIHKQIPLLYEREIINLNYRKSIPTKWMVLDQDFTSLTADNICPECGIDHSFRPNFEGVKTSIDVIPQLLQSKHNNNQVKVQEAAK
jgi:hypothetical protein